ncbi:MAG: hypothetical protein IT257_04005, partial [Chitinophagaceae bacterium]|nr:hypothetical protein [Chitinophagaceae bacterium]
MKRISILSILLFCLKSFSYSVPAWAWTHTFNGTVRAVEYAGNYFYTAGTYSDSAFVYDNTTLPNNGSKDIFIAKWDSSGNMIWAKSVWGSAYDSVVSIKVNSNNELILSGSSNSAVLHADAITVNSNGGYDMFIAKYDLNGNALNAYFYGTAGNEYSIDMCVDYLNNIYVASANKLTQYNNSGVQVWQKSLTATQGNYVGHVIYSTFDSTVILTGTYAGIFTLNAVTLNTLFMLSWNYWPQKIYYAKINPNSNLVWLKDDGIDTHAQHTPNIFAKASNGYIYTAYQQFGGLGGTYYAFREQFPNGNMTNAAFGGLPVAGQGYDNDVISIIAVSGNASYVSVSTDNSFDGQTLLIYNVVNHTVEKIYNVFTKSPHIFRSKTAIYTPSAAPNYSWGKISHDSLLGAPTYQ